MKKLFFIPLFAALFSFASVGASAQTVDTSSPDGIIKTVTPRTLTVERLVRQDTDAAAG